MTTPPSMTYASLQTDIQNYTERFDQPFVSQIPRFIMMAENRIASEVRGLGFVRFVNGQLTASNGTIQKPARWRETGSLFVVGSSGRMDPIKQRDYSYLRLYWPNPTQTGTPKYYADYGYEHLVVVPAPTTDTNFELSYYERPEPLSDSNQTNWTTQYAPQLLLYGALLEAQPFLKRPERTKEFEELFDRASAAVSNEAQRRMNGDQTLIRSGLQ